METKPLVYGIVGFIVGGFIVSLAATTFEKPKDAATEHATSSLEDKKGDDFDKAFLDEMIKHHQGAVDMAKLSEKQAKHQELKDLSRAMLDAQKSEIELMRFWQHEWGYANKSDDHKIGH